jgi:hypothetical protein
MLNTLRKQWTVEFRAAKVDEAEAAASDADAAQAPQA